ncbi:TonB-dependent receptor domain-containing protein [Sphingomonas bacterium]|uniref:TonB-dependent receptor domain-containing protein n=1 Tax=Sphingomonas bacterium TaxID=1895847 RepID=UPI0034A00961
MTDLHKDIQFSVETRLAGSRGPIDYQLGFFYFDEQVRLTSSATTFGSSESFSLAPTRYDTQSYAPFVHLTAHVASGLCLVGGVRYTHDAKQLVADSFSISAGCAIPFTCANTVLPPAVLYAGQLPFTIPAAPGTIADPTPGSTVTRSSDVVFNQRLSAGRVTYRGAVEYDVAPASLLYASVESGFRSGGFNTSVGFETFQPEYITAYSIGSKNRFLGNRVQLNLEGFYWDYRNEQVAHSGLDLAVPPRANSIVQNVGRADIKGVEVEGRVLVTPTTTLSADVQYLDAKNKFFTYQVPIALQSLTGCAVSPAATPGFLNVNCAGRPAFNSPNWTLNLGAEQKIPVGDYQFIVSADTQYKSSRYEGFEYQQGELQRASWTTNAQLFFGPANGRWSVAGFVRDIENDRLLAVPFSFGGVLVAYTTPPRTYGLRGSVKF